MPSSQRVIIFLFIPILSAMAQSPSRGSLVSAIETLAESGFTAMSLTLQLISDTLPFGSGANSTLTIFSPPNTAFSSSGQPSQDQLFLHLSPIFLSHTSLISLPYSSTIRSLSNSGHLVVTSNGNGTISIDNVRVSESPIFDDGFVIVYGIDDFFDMNFTLVVSRNSPTSAPNLPCGEIVERASRFEDASRVLKSRGYSIMASFLNLQLMGFLDHGSLTENMMRLTVFAPVDEELVKFSGDFLGDYSLFLRHLTPCRTRWSDLEQMINGTVVSKNINGLNLEISMDGNHDTLMINGVEVVFPDMYVNEWLSIHGIRGVIPNREIV